MKKKLVSLLSLAVLLVFPELILAVNPGPLPNTQLISITNIVNKILDFIWPIFMGFAVIMFIVAGFLFLVAGGEPGKIASARSAVLWGVVGVSIGVLAFTIPFLIRRSLGL